MASVEETPSTSTENAMKVLVPIINKLRDAFVMMKDSPIDLPRIAVVGSQSAGKSSVLENIVGRSFLPRGSGIVTRCPCEIRMHALPEGQPPYALVASAQDSTTRYDDFEAVRVKIEQETHRVCGPRGLSTAPILLDIYSPDVVDLTLVDLPGAVRIAAEGQDPRIVAQIRDMILDYIKRENVIILAVNAANTDLANSDAIAFSRLVDPRGERTLAVLTKLDLMDEGTDARGILTMEDPNAPKLKLGYVGVVNRSQKDISDCRSLVEARAKEASYFANHAAYRTLDHTGTHHLVQRCSQLLVQAIQRELPSIDAKVKELIARKEEELLALPETTPETMRIHYQEIVRQFESNFSGMLEGSIRLDDTQLHGGARIANLFEYNFQNSIMSLQVQGLESMDDSTTNRIRTMIKNRQGLSGGLYVPNDAFHTLVKEQVGLTEGPCLECARDVLSEMQKVQRNATEKVALLQSFPRARAALIKQCNEILQLQHTECVKYLKTHVRMNQLRISYEHPDFHKERILFEVEQKRYGNEDSEADQECLAKARSGQDLTKDERIRVRAITERRQRAQLEEQRSEADLAQRPSNGQTRALQPSAASAAAASSPSLSVGLSSPPLVGSGGGGGAQSPAHKIRMTDRVSPKEELEIEKLLALTRAYFFLVQKQVVDLVPKYIQLLLVEEPKELITKAIGAMTDGQVSNLMAPSPEVKQKRMATMAALTKLREAEQMLFEVAQMDSQVSGPGLPMQPF